MHFKRHFGQSIWMMGLNTALRYGILQHTFPVLSNMLHNVLQNDSLFKTLVEIKSICPIILKQTDLRFLLCPSHKQTCIGRLATVDEESQVRVSASWTAPGFAAKEVRGMLRLKFFPLIISSLNFFSSGDWSYLQGRCLDSYTSPPLWQVPARLLLAQAPESIRFSLQEEFRWCKFWGSCLWGFLRLCLSFGVWNQVQEMVSINKTPCHSTSLLSRPSISDAQPEMVSSNDSQHLSPTVPLGISPEVKLPVWLARHNVTSTSTRLRQEDIFKCTKCLC